MSIQLWTDYVENSTAMVLRSPWNRLKNDLEAEAFQAPDVVALNVSCVDFIKMLWSQFAIGCLIFEHMVNDHEESMSYCRNSLLLPSANHQPVIKSGQIGPFLSSGCPSGFDEISA